MDETDCISYTPCLQVRLRLGQAVDAKITSGLAARARVFAIVLEDLTHTFDWAVLTISSETLLATSGPAFMLLR
jgi:hypothetical protein